MEGDSEVVFRPLSDFPTLSPRRAPLRSKECDCTQDDSHGGSCSPRSIRWSDENSTSRIQQLELPFDALVEVFKHLVPLAYMNFRAASRACRSALPPVKWSNPLSGSENSLPVPFLMSVVHKNDQHLYEVVDPRLNGSKCNSYLMKIPSSLANSAIRYSDGGWVLATKDGAIDLYNVFSGEIISATSSDGWSIGRNHSLFFTTASGGESVDVVVSVFFWDDGVYVFTIAPDEEHWTVDNVSIDLKSRKGFSRAHVGPVFLEDAFYYLDRDGNLGKLEISVENDEYEYYEASWEVLEMSLNPRDRCSECFYLVESDGDLLSVFVGRVGEWVSVYRLNQAEMVWETVASLGNYALYLSRASTFSVKTSPDSGNRIYFPWVGDSGIAFFSVKTGKWHFSGSGALSRHLLVPLSGTKLRFDSLLYDPCWIKSDKCLNYW